MNESKAFLVDPTGNELAELILSDEEQGWFYGRLFSQRFPAEILKALAWYDEVVQHQMLSYLDEALSAVEQFGLNVKFRDGSIRPVYSLHIGQPNEVSFRVTPVPPPSHSPSNNSI